MKITFNFLVPITLQRRQLLKAFIIDIFKKEGTPLHRIDFILCSDEYLLEINKAFLQHDYYTDIITFNLANKSQPVEGEVYISVDTVRSNAERFSTTLNKELHRVIFHGVLHLCGYNDKTQKQQKTMTTMEDHYLDNYFNVPRGA